MIASLVCALACYFSIFQEESLEAMDYVASHQDEINTSLENLKPDERNIALAIVAPELSQYSTICDFMELNTLYALCRKFGKLYQRRHPVDSGIQPFNSERHGKGTASQTS